MVYALTEELVAEGHEVTLFASGYSISSAILIPTCSRSCATADARLSLPFYCLAVEEAYRRANDFDIIHNHIEYLWLPYSTRIDVKSLSTYHNVLPHEWRQFITKFPLHPSVSISHWQRSQFPRLNWSGTIHDGISLSTYTFIPQSKSYLAFVGRIEPSKGVEEAVQLAFLLGMPLKIAGNITNPTYFQQVQQLIGNSSLIEYCGILSECEKNEFLGNAEWLVYTSGQQDPFAMVLIEALACGTPIISLKGNCSEEFIRNGVTGIILNSISDSLNVDRGKAEMMRESCRQDFEQRFTSNVMASRYLQLYEALL